jgi:nucleoside-diphosphate-sugar epimerase
VIFLLGGNGFIGSGFARLLQQRKEPFEVITRENYLSYLGKSCDVLINANGNSKKFLAADDPKAEFQASVASVRNSLVDFKYDTYVYLSTSDVYPDCSKPELTQEDQYLDIAHQSPYGFHKYLAEQCVIHAAKNYLIIRQGGFVGPGLKKNAVYDVLYGSKLWVHPQSRFQFIHTEESAIAVLNLLDKKIKNETFNLTGMGTVSVAEIMELVPRDIPYPEGSEPQRYEISTTKISKLLNLPHSRQSILHFISETLIR